MEISSVRNQSSLSLGLFVIPRQFKLHDSIPHLVCMTTFFTLLNYGVFVHVSTPTFSKESEVPSAKPRVGEKVEVFSNSARRHSVQRQLNEHAMGSWCRKAEEMPNLTLLRRMTDKEHLFINTVRFPGSPAKRIDIPII